MTTTQTPIQAAWERIEAARLRGMHESVDNCQPNISPVNISSQSRNVMRPRTLEAVVGQEPAKELLEAAIARTHRTGEPLPHMLMTGPAGTGKTTLSHVVGHELGVNVYQFEAPLSHDTMLELATVMRDGDVLFLDEIHQQALGDRRGRSATLQPEALYGVMEDQTLATATGVLPFPKITMIGATTDPGRLPEAFLSRFPLRPRLIEYTEDDMILMAARNAFAIGLQIRLGAARLLASASRGTPREMNNLITNASLWSEATIEVEDAEKTLKLSGITKDGLTTDMVELLRFLYTRARRVTQAHGARYQASVNTIATAIGLARDTKAVALHVEPWLIRQGLIQVAHGGRLLTDAGIARAKELV